MRNVSSILGYALIVSVVVTIGAARTGDAWLAAVAGSLFGAQLLAVVLEAFGQLS